MRLVKCKELVKRNQSQIPFQGQSSVQMKFKHKLINYVLWKKTTRKLMVQVGNCMTDLHKMYNVSLATVVIQTDNKVG